MIRLGGGELDLTSTNDRKRNEQRERLAAAKSKGEWGSAFLGKKERLVPEGTFMPASGVRGKQEKKGRRVRKSKAVLLNETIS